jgi:VanZ family protein
MQAILRSDLRLAKRWFFGALAALAFVFLLALLPNFSKPPDTLYLDKVAHFFGFMGLMILFSGVLLPRLRLWVFLLLAMCGGLIEVLQVPVPGRSAEMADIYADILGLATGWLIVQAGIADWCLWLEKRMGLV